MVKNRKIKNSDSKFAPTSRVVESEIKSSENTNIEDKSDDRVWSVFSTLLVFTTAMFTFPLLCYFISKTYLFEGI